MSTVATGMALGAGSEVGHQAVRSMMGGGGGHGGGHGEPAAQEQPMQQPMYAQEQQQQQQQLQDPCMGFNQNLMSCLQQNRGEINMCQAYMDMLTQCQRDQSMNTMNYQ